MKSSNLFANFAQFALSTEEVAMVKGGAPSGTWYCEFHKNGKSFSKTYSSAESAFNDCGVGGLGFAQDAPCSCGWIEY